MGARTITLALGGVWQGDNGLVPCSVLGPKRYPELWAISIQDHSRGFCVTTLKIEKAQCMLKGFIEPEYCGLDVLGSRDTKRLKAWLRDWLERVLDDEVHHEQERQIEWLALRIWHKARPIEGSPAEAQLRSLGIPGPLPEVLRYHPQCWHPFGPPRPAMVALLNADLDVVDSDRLPDEMQHSVALHATYLPQVGSAEDPSGFTEYLVGDPGSAVEVVSLPLEVDAPIVVAESVLSALALASGLMPGPTRILAALSPEGLAELRLPEWAGWDKDLGWERLRQPPARLIIAPDSGAESQTAAQSLAEEARRHGWDVELLTAPDGQTWMNMLAQKQGSPGLQLAPTCRPEARPDQGADADSPC